MRRATQRACGSAQGGSEWPWAGCGRKREAGARGAATAEDPDDEFGGEEAFLNLDDVLEGDCPASCRP